MERRRGTMEYDVMIHNADLLIDAFDADHDVIYATGLTLISSISAAVNAATNSFITPSLI